MINISNELNVSESIHVSRMKIGDVGIIISQVHTEYIGHLVVNTFEGLISLTNPHTTWSDISGVGDSFRVKLVDIDIIVKEKS